MQEGTVIGKPQIIAAGTDGFSGYLEALYTRYNHPEYISPDPLEVVLEYPELRDRETAGLLCSCLALGRVDCIVSACRRLTGLLPVPPGRAGTLPEKDIRQALEGFTYRFFNAPLLTRFIKSIGRIQENWGSLEALFHKGYNRAGSVRDGMDFFVREFRKAAGGLPGILLPAPEDGSACKRFNLFLRWMVRKDAVDPGCWSSVDKAGLLIPLDTHMLRTARGWGATARKTADILAAEEVTRWFSRFCPEDPVKYDFSVLRPFLYEPVRSNSTKI
jgi:uncharacterized protein (TIGR02757 family)